MAANQDVVLSDAAQRWLRHFGCQTAHSVAVLFESGRISEARRPPGLTIEVMHELKRFSGDPEAQPFQRSATPSQRNPISREGRGHG